MSNKSVNNGEEADVRKGPWTMEEDLILVNYIANHGEGVWNSLARSAGTQGGETGEPNNVLHFRKVSGLEGRSARHSSTSEHAHGLQFLFLSVFAEECVNVTEVSECRLFLCVAIHALLHGKRDMAANHYNGKKKQSNVILALICRYHRLLMKPLFSPMRWSKIARQLPGRTDNEIKNYWRTRIQKRVKQSDSPEFQNAILIDEANNSTSQTQIADAGRVQPSRPDEPTIMNTVGIEPQFSTDSNDFFWTFEELWSMQSPDDDHLK
ncbi:hypothetical protein B296_00019053 [Ensete ventricosum]|uniref:HTH myb-type domain-containing protein n=1 Tax=Ensete ventricosum TaxID=4639 RepID=A0A427B0B3_ENSVE|nr:hypothetical protein B296_00019053 [Ensete ventricosum]